jgi:AcrR family transcriptional regulator
MGTSGGQRTERGAAKVTKEDWLKAAIRVLTREGVDQVLVLPLAAKLGVARSSFYWYFENRQDLLRQLLDYWMNTNTRAVVARAERASDNIVEGVLGIFECWVDERLYSPRLDFGVRNWGRRSPSVRRLVAKADDDCILAIKAMYRRHGYEDEDAFIRARVLYVMQIGYYTLDLKEPMEARLSHLEAYLRAFTGREPPTADLRRFRKLTQSHKARGEAKAAAE